MQLHHDSQTVDPGAFTAKLNTAGPAPFVHVEMGSVRFYADTPDECDAAIRVWVEAKRLLLGEPEQDEGDLAGTPFPGRPGYVTGACGHAVAGSEWDAGYRNCEHCGERRGFATADAELDHIAIEGTLS